MPTVPLLILVGPSKAGKTTVGRLLAERLHVGFRDTDHDVEKVTGMSVAEVFSRYGEQRFRELEREAFSAALHEHDGVLSLGGGALLDPATQEDLHTHGRTLALSLSLPEALERTRVAKGVAVLTIEQREKINRRVPERLRIARSLALPEVGTDGVPLEAVAERCLALLEALRIASPSC